jgi:hypothetical protein
MRKYSSLEWFKCDGCDHLYTESPSSSEQAPSENTVDHRTLPKEPSDVQNA